MAGKGQNSPPVVVGWGFLQRDSRQGCPGPGITLHVLPTPLADGLTENCSRASLAGTRGAAEREPGGQRQASPLASGKGMVGMKGWCSWESVDARPHRSGWRNPAERKPTQPALPAPECRDQAPLKVGCLAPLAWESLWGPRPGEGQGGALTLKLLL